MKESRRFRTDGALVYTGDEFVAQCRSNRFAKMIANALNLYRRKVSRPQAAEKQK
jgi:hypothetical protein